VKVREEGHERGYRVPLLDVGMRQREGVDVREGSWRRRREIGQRIEGQHDVLQGWDTMKEGKDTVPAADTILLDVEQLELREGRWREWLYLCVRGGGE
jgi:hypothetical protein